MYYRDSTGENCPAIKRRRLIDGQEVTTRECDVVSANILEVEAGTNGYCGGDSRHGSRTYFRIKDCGGMDMRIQMMPGGFSVVLGGNCELSTIKDALRWILSILEVQSENAGDE